MKISAFKIGMIGGLITLAANVIGLFVMKQDAAHFFANAWWSVWFPSYCVWFVIAVIGAARGPARKRKA